MTAVEILSAVIIHLVIPLAGLLAYIGVVRKMIAEKVDNPPVIELFLVFATYGGLSLVTLTALFWKWSGMASLGTFYLVLGAPVVMGVIAYRNYKFRKLSKYHLWAYKSGLLYFILMPLGLLVLVASEERL